MSQDKLDIDNMYKPIIIDVDELCGISMNTAKEGEQVKVLQKFFFNSYEVNHKTFFDAILSPFLGNVPRDINNLIVIVRDKKAYIYTKFPLVMKIRPKVDLKQFHAVFENQILDIEGIEFKDSIFELDIKDGDKFLWLFRSDWNFGLYFDFSGKLNSKEISTTLGNCYKKLKYYGLYDFLSSEESFDNLLEEGWFPFVQILGTQFDGLRQADGERDFKNLSDSIIESFNEERIKSFTQYWWRNSIFNSKKDILEAGLKAFLANTPEQTINCIKNLSSEIEGIIRLDYHLSKSKKPSMKELKEYILSCGEKRFSTTDSLGFPGLFFRYLNDVIFKGFDVEKRDIPLSRHSVSHGVAVSGDYSRERALQLILTLDQIYFYLGSNTNKFEDKKG